jgi:hypothetical protein
MHLSVSSPSSLSVDPDVDVAPEADAAQEPDDTVDDLALAAELPGKQPLLSIPISPTLLSLMLALEVTAAVVILFLLHSLFIVTCFVTYLLILNCLE